MKRPSVLLAVFILCLQGVAMGVASAELPNITDAGQTDELDRALVLWSVLDDGNVLTVDEEGNVSINAFNDGVLSAQWSLFLNVNANKARIDDANELVTVSHQTGAFVVQLSTESIYENITLPDPVNDAEWDHQGDIWLAQYAGKRRAEEYTSSLASGIGTTIISQGISAFEILTDGRIAMASYDKKIYIHDNGGQLINTISDSTGIISSLVETSNGTLLAGTTGGTIYKFDTDSWSVQTLSLPHTKQITYISEHGSEMYAIGAKQGHFSFVNSTNFTELETYTGEGDVIGFESTFMGQLFIVGSTPSATKISFYDLDSDMDGVNDLNDDFPNDPSQTTDSDEDGYGDDPTGFNPDSFPSDGTQWEDSDDDGYGDNPTGTNPDLFPNNPDQWSDLDGDGYGDNSGGLNGDVFPEEATQWSDSDKDSYGDNPEGFRPDSCPTVNGFSTEDRFGCPDTDFDGYSNPDVNWTSADGADALPSQATQWEDQDSDGYGDASEGDLPDACPWEFGESTKAWVIDGNSSLGYTESPSYGCEDLDGDGWVDRTESPLMDKDPNEHYDGDGDGVGSNADYDDTSPNIATEQDYCLNNKNDTSEGCLGWNDPAFQAYKSNLVNETALGYYAWNASLTDDTSGTSSLNVDDETLNQVIKVGFATFAGLTAVILLVAYIMDKRKVATSQKVYGGVTASQSSNASKEALEGKGGISAEGGIISDEIWDDDVKQLNFEPEEDGFGDMEIKTGENAAEAVSMTYEEESIEAIAGMPSTQTASTTEPEPVGETTIPDEAPPLPEEGLPDGWTMDQWRWYGHEWLEKYGKN
ncbi:MAG TPA: hypothetical protein QGI72_05100 [Poseidonia sp.]|nr:hypothetical protein [Poseidonia sp.]